MFDGKKTHCDKFIMKTWIICLNVSTSSTLISFRTLVPGKNAS